MRPMAPPLAILASSLEAARREAMVVSSMVRLERMDSIGTIVMFEAVAL